MHEPDTITIQRSAGAVAFEALLKKRGLGPRSAAAALNSFAEGRQFPGEPVTIAHPMVIDWRAGKKRPDDRHQALIRLWAQERDHSTGAIVADPLPESLWSIYRAPSSGDPASAPAA